MAKERKRGCFGKSGTCLEWIKGPTCALYSSYVLSAWGDWMWQFAAGLYLVYLANGMLRLAAIFGFAGNTLMLLLGGIIGDWVDQNRRMKVVVVSLFIQNMSVALCATSVCLVLVFHDHIYDGMHGMIRVIVEAVVIGLALIAFLASMAYKIAIEKDWIVVVAGDDKTKLTNLNAVTRAIDLSCKIFAPTVAGLIMSYSHIIAAIFIAVWNVVSVICEYYLLRRVYRLVPQLAVKGANSEEPKESEMKIFSTNVDEEGIKTITDEKEPMNPDDSDEKQPMKATAEADEENNIISNGNANHEVKQPLKSDKPKHGYKVSDPEHGKKMKKKCWQLALEPFVTLVTGWKTYIQQKVVLAGLALALLYMTVLGFDYVTTGYIYANGVQESYVGLSMALAGVTGIIGTFVFSFVNKRLGLERTGLIAFSSEILCLTLTVASIWAPGTVFDPTFSRQTNCTAPALAYNSTSDPGLNDLTNLVNATADIDVRVKRHISTYELELLHQNGGDVDDWRVGTDFPLARTMMRMESSMVGESLNRKRRALDIEDPKPDTCVKSKATVSIILFLIGIITSRVGLWMADLVVTQLFQENVDEMERGIVNGVQNSLNMLMDMIKNALVIALPSVETFGILIILSFIFIISAAGLFVGHVARADKSVFLCHSRPKPKLVVVDEMQVNSDENKPEEV